MPNTIEVVNSVNEARRIQNDIIEESVRRMNDKNPLMNADVSIVTVEDDLTDKDNPRQVGVVYKCEVRPQIQAIPYEVPHQLNEDEMRSLDLHLTKMRVKDMASPFVPENLSEDKIRPFSELYHKNSHIIFDIGTLGEADFDFARDVDLEFMSHDLSRTNNMRLLDFEKEVQSGIEEVAGQKKNVKQCLREAQTIGWRFLNSIGVQPPSNFYSLSPESLRKRIMDELRRAEKHNRVSREDLDNLSIFHIYMDAVDSEKGKLGRLGTSVFSESLQTDGYEFPSSVNTIEQLVDESGDFKIGTADFLNHREK